MKKKVHRTTVGDLEERYGGNLGYKQSRTVSSVLKERGASSLSALVDMADASGR